MDDNCNTWRQYAGNCKSVLLFKLFRSRYFWSREFQILEGMLTKVDIDQVISAYLYLVNRLSNLGKIYSRFKNREIRKLTLRGTLKVSQNWKFLMLFKRKKAIKPDPAVKGLCFFVHSCLSGSLGDLCARILGDHLID